MKAALIYPEYYEIAHFKHKRKEIPPFGVLYLASVLEQEGVEVKIYKVSIESAKFDFSEYDLVGFSLSSSVTYSIIKQVRKQSKFSKRNFTMAGGIHASLYPHQVLEELNVDLVSIGEGEETLKEIAHYIQAGRQGSLDSIKGIYFRSNEQIIKTPDREAKCDINHIPFPARHLLDEEDFIMNNRLSDTKLKCVHILCSRGCPYFCNFCANREHRIRYRSGANIRKELEILKAQYGIEGFCITDDNFIVNKDNVIEIFEEVKSLGLKWSALSRVDTVDEELLKILKESGCIEIKYGIESGSQRILDAMNKKITVEQIRQAITLTHKIGIKVKAFILHGFPPEDMASTQETIDLLEKLKDKIHRISVFRFTPLPGSPAYDQHEEFEICLPQSMDDIYIYNNENKWWGNQKQQEELEAAYQRLEKYIKDNWEKY